MCHLVSKKLLLVKFHLQYYLQLGYYPLILLKSVYLYLKSKVCQRRILIFHQWYHQPTKILSRQDATTFRMDWFRLLKKYQSILHIVVFSNQTEFLIQIDKLFYRYYHLMPLKFYHLVKWKFHKNSLITLHHHQIHNQMYNHHLLNHTDGLWSLCQYYHHLVL